MKTISAPGHPARWTRGLLRCGQAADFTVTGALFLAGAAGLSRAGGPAATSRAERALIGAAGAGIT